ncbi:hypothetical protein QC762_701010 [Podospora pseudocomata]|uniref:MARVEL domain-containing protein n=1 Tax=Podospora pseudocomata TaxID=2093779 RepID=A0ABR0G5G6_9PEZI|nr:hypothetical protein QC762_701010 [Podospora pseudocomata]
MTEPSPATVETLPETAPSAAVAKTDVFTEPRTSAQIRKENRATNPDRAPYHRIWSLFSRGILLVLELAAIGYTAYAHELVNRPDSPFEGGVKDFGTSFAAFAVGVAVNLSCVIACFIDRYDASGAGIAGFLDLIPGILGIVAFFSVALAGYGYGGSDYYDRVGYKAERTAVAQLSLAVGILHILSCFGACVGCCIVCTRPKSTTVKSRPQGDKEVSSKGGEPKIAAAGV